MSDSKDVGKSSAKNKKDVYRMEEVPLDVALGNSGEFRCAPDPSACEDKESARAMLNVFKKMPGERRGVWVPRLDKEETFRRCTIFKEDSQLSKELDELCAASDTNKQRTKQTDQQQQGGERGNERE